MNDDEPELSPSDREAIAAIRRQLDREFADPLRDPPVRALALLEPSAPPARESTGLTIALALGAGTLLAASMMVLTTYTAPSGGAQAPHGSPSPPAGSPASRVASIAAAPPRPDSVAAQHVGAGRRQPEERVTLAESPTPAERVTTPRRRAAPRAITVARISPPAERRSQIQAP